MVVGPISPLLPCVLIVQLAVQDLSDWLIANPFKLLAASPALMIIWSTLTQGLVPTVVAISATTAAAASRLREAVLFFDALPRAEQLMVVVLFNLLAHWLSEEE